MCQCIKKILRIMKKLMFCLFVLFTAVNCKTIHKSHVSVHDKTQTQVEFNILYPGLHYLIVPIRYKFSYPDTMDIRLSGKNVRIAEESNILSIRPRQNSFKNTGEIYVINNKTGDTLQTKIFHAVLPPIQLDLGGVYNGGIIPYDKLISTCWLGAGIYNFEINLVWPIYSFTLEMQSGDSIISIPRNYPERCKNRVLWWEPDKECWFFSPEQLKALETIQGTQIIVIKDIVVPLDSNVNYVIDHAVWYVKREKE